MSKETDRRRAERIRTDLRVVILTGESNLDAGHIRDLSRTGFYIPGTPGLDIGTRCLIKLYPRGAEDQGAVAAEGRIARVDGDGMGVEFLELDEGTLGNLVRILASGSKGE